MPSKPIYTCYRTIWRSHFGEIPKDENGRSYEIHHIDGDRTNNSIENLQCLSIEEHYELHLKQGDYAACLLISDRYNISPEEKSKLARLQQLTRIANGTHHLVNNPSIGQVTVKDANGKTFRVSVDDERYQSGELVGVRKGLKGQNKGRTDLVSVIDKDGNTKKVSKEEFRANPDLRHPMKGRVSVVDKDGNTFTVEREDPRYICGELVGVTKTMKRTCPHCKKTGTPGAMARWHFGNCKHKKGD